MTPFSSLMTTWSNDGNLPSIPTLFEFWNVSFHSNLQAILVCRSFIRVSFASNAYVRLSKGKRAAFIRSLELESNASRAEMAAVGRIWMTQGRERTHALAREMPTIHMGTVDRSQREGVENLAARGWTEESEISTRLPNECVTLRPRE